MKRSEYKWNLFKMTWLVPNYARARGPAWWAWNAMDWWRRETDTHNYCSKISRFKRWWSEKAVKWLTPWMCNARKFMDVCANCSDTKLLEFKAGSLYMRTRDENHFYYTIKSNLLGNVSVWRGQWLNKKGRPQNIFAWSVISGLCGNDGEPFEMPEKRTEMIWMGRILTAGQLKSALSQITQYREFGWDWLLMERRRLSDEFEKMGLAEPFRLVLAVEQAILKRDFPGKKEYCELDEIEKERLIDTMRSLAAKEALDLSRR